MSVYVVGNRERKKEDWDSKKQEKSIDVIFKNTFSTTRIIVQKSTSFLEWWVLITM